MNLLKRFLNYVAINTQSDSDSETYPSTPGQLILLRQLADELREIGAVNVKMDKFGYVTASITATQGFENEPVIGFLAHVDTSPDACGSGINPQLVETGNDTVIKTDGTTLLGADDKAGVAEIMTAAEYLILHPEVAHGTVRIAFTPDEEVGRGVDHFDVEAFGADFAYTMDGGAIGEFEFENFNAAEAKIRITGQSIHPGYAKDQMVNALRVAIELDALLPPEQRPEHTENREGFFLLTKLEGIVEGARMEYIIRDHDREKFENRKKTLSDAVAEINRRFGEGTVSLDMHDQYYNMREVVEKHPQVVERALVAMQRVGIEPIVKAIRGGTDGARLSFMGLPCPNIFAGGENFHGPLESASLNAMKKAVEVIVEIARAR